jgi:hypothetical protein
MTTERKQYPVDYSKVSMEQTEQEQQYDMSIEEKVLAGQLHPRFVRWYSEDPNNEEPVSNGNISKIRYRTCKLCPMFEPALKVCDQCGCFMPIKVQFKMFSCPLNKWPE